MWLVWSRIIKMSFKSIFDLDSSSLPSFWPVFMLRPWLGIFALEEKHNTMPCMTQTWDFCFPLAYLLLFAASRQSTFLFAFLVHGAFLVPFQERASPLWLWVSCTIFYILWVTKPLNFIYYSNEDLPHF